METLTLDRKLLRLLLMGLAAASLWVAGCASSAPAAVASPADTRPNIIFILADDLGWGDLGCYPSRPEDGPKAVVRTPHLDSLAASGARFTSAYANHHVCAPSRTGMLTGQHQQRLGYFGFEETMAPLPPDVPLLPEPLRAAGYTTALIGKWHVSYIKGSRPLDRGFERFFGFLGGEHDYFEPNIGQPFHGISYSRDAHVYDQDKPVERMDYLTDELTTRSLEFMDAARKSNRPFFLYLSHHAPHTPLQARWEDLEPFATARDEPATSRDIVRAMIVRLDHNVGRLVSHLRDRGWLDNTLIVFSSDNGASQPAYSGGLRGRKGYFYEGGIRVPLIVSWPARIAAGQVVDDPVITHDIFPTALAAAGISKLPKGVEGLNWLPRLTGQTKMLPSRKLYWAHQNKNNSWAVRDGRWKLVLEDTGTWFNSFPKGDTDKRDQRSARAVQLYDLEADPFETKDLAARHPDIVRRLQTAIDDFYATHPSSLYTKEWRDRAVALRKERDQNPDRYPSTIRIDGAPGHWNQTR